MIFIGGLGGGGECNFKSGMVLEGGRLDLKDLPDLVLLKGLAEHHCEVQVEMADILGSPSWSLIASQNLDC